MTRFWLIMIKTNFFNILFFILCNNFILSQTSSSVTIKDHNGNSGIININCDYKFKPGHKITLTADYPVLKSTLNYDLDSISFNPIGEFTEGTEIKVSKDDKWSDIIKFPQGFKFCYYGTTYDSFVVGDNGVISFDLAKAGTDLAPTFDGEISSEKSNLSTNTIFGAYHDMTNDKDVFGCSGKGDCGQILMNIVGKAPFRKLVVNYNNMSHFNCPDITSTFQIVLYETTNEIEVNLKSKPKTCDYGYEKKTLIGITDSEAKGIAPESRNTGVWEAKDEAWRFVPKGEAVPYVQWYYINGQGKEINLNNISKNSIDVDPVKNLVYGVKVFYKVCGVEYLSDKIRVVYSNYYPQAEEVTGNFCYEHSFLNEDFNLENLILKSIGNQGIENVTLHKTLYDALEDINPIDFNVKVNKDEETFYIRLNKGENCFTTAAIKINLYKKPDIKEQTVLACFEKIIPDKIKLENYNGSILGASGVMEYYHTKADAEKGINQVLEIPINLNVPVTLYLKAYIKEVPNCSSEIIPISFLFRPQIEEVNKIIKTCDVNDKFCMDLTDYEKDDAFKNKEGYKFSYYALLTDAWNGGKNGQIENTDNYCFYLGTRVFVRVEKEGYCPNVGEISLVASNSNVDNINEVLCDTKGEGKVYVDIGELYEKMVANHSVDLYGIYLNGNLVEKENYKNFPITKNEIFTVRFHDKKANCDFSRSIKIDFNKMIAKNTDFNICNLGSEDSGTFYLSNINEEMLDGYIDGSTVSYHLTEEDALKNINPQTSIKVITGEVKYIYARINNNILWVNCPFVYKLTFTLQANDLDQLNNLTELICDQNQNGKEVVNLELYESKIINNPSNFKISYYLSYDDAIKNIHAILNPKEVELNIPSIIYVKVKSRKSICFNIAELKFKNSNELNVEDTEINICATSSNFNYVLNLKDYVKNMLVPDTIVRVNQQELKISFYRTEKGANELSKEDELSSQEVEKYTVKSSQEFVWVRFQQDNGCYVVRKMDINLRPLPKTVNANFLVCDDDLDGVYKLNLEDLNHQVIGDPQDYTFNYYDTSYEDAEKDIDNSHSIKDREYVISGFTKDIFVKVTSKYGCSKISKVLLYTQDILPLKINDTEIENCDEDYDGKTSFNLLSVAKEFTDNTEAVFIFFKTLEDAKNNKKAISNPTKYKNENPISDVVYFRVIAPGFCPAWGLINLKVQTPPKAPDLKQRYKICPNGSIEIDAGINPEIVSYEWGTMDGNIVTDKTDHKITITSAGNYWVKIVGQNGCPITLYISVTEYDKVQILDLVEGKDYIKVIAEGPGHLEYSMDQENWQKSNTFTGLEPGVYTFYVRSVTNGCYSLEAKGVLFNILNVITPNNDGYNDVWRLCGLEHFNGKPSHIKIFNREGKVVFEENSTDCFIWDGYYLGRPLPTTSYWYIVEIADGRKFSGWILLRNYDGDAM